MIYLLDTNVCIKYLRGKNSVNIESKLKAASTGSVAICSVVKAELQYGAERSMLPQRNLAQLQNFYSGFPSLPFDDRAAIVYGKLRANLESTGASVGPNDLMIAAIAVANGLVLVTHNIAEFSRVPALAIEDWQSL